MIKRLTSLRALGALIFFMLISSGVFAQLQQGTVILGGKIGLSSQKTTYPSTPDNKTNTYTFGPRLGYFVEDKFLLGADIQFSKTDNTALENRTSNTFRIGPFGRYYVPLANSFLFYGEASVYYQNQETESGTDPFHGKIGYKGFGTYVSPGFAFFPARKVSIELQFEGISYNRLREKDLGSKVSVFSLGTNFFTPSIGLLFHL